MGDQDDFMVSETAEHLVSPPLPLVSDTPNMSRPSMSQSFSNRRKNRSEVWDHFTVDSESNRKVKCNYCSTLMKADNGTSSLRNHMKKCKDNPNNDVNRRQNSVSSSPSVAKFDPEKCRIELVRMFVAMDIPFRRVEHEAFQRFLKVLQPKFHLISRFTLARDVLLLWEEEKAKLKNFLSQHCQRVCLTTDTWTADQNLSYMCLTVHFIDNNWKLHNKILNFCQVTSHSGKVMAKSVEKCLDGWGLNRVLSVTVDNASSNDVGIQYLKKRLMSWNGLVLGGDYIHMRCCAHILNLVVKEGLKEIDDSIFRIRAAVKYVRSSPSRLAKFKGYVPRDIEYKGLVCLDVETRWNSTYLMLEAALKHQRTFEELDMKDTKYSEELKKGKGVPTNEDWDYIRNLLPFLKMFYDATLCISGSNYVTSNMYMLEVLGIGKKIKQFCHSRDENTRAMAIRMKKKYDKYWKDPGNLNILLFVAVVLDPRYKLKFVNWLISQNFDVGEAIVLNEKIETCLKLVFEEYDGRAGGSQGDSQGILHNDPYGYSEFFQASDDPYDYNQFFQSSGGKVSELTKYLEEALESPENFEILNWWKFNSNRFPILASIAREVLAIPVSTVASESAFSTGGRVLDSHRSSLTPKIVEALICTQDWLKGYSSPLLSNEEFEELEKIEQGKLKRCV